MRRIWRVLVLACAVAAACAAGALPYVPDAQAVCGPLRTTLLEATITSVESAVDALYSVLAAGNQEDLLHHCRQDISFFVYHMATHGPLKRDPAFAFLATDASYYNAFHRAYANLQSLEYQRLCFVAKHVNRLVGGLQRDAFDKLCKLVRLPAKRESTPIVLQTVPHEVRVFDAHFPLTSDAFVRAALLTGMQLNAFGTILRHVRDNFTPDDIIAGIKHLHTEWIDTLHLAMLTEFGADYAVQVGMSPTASLARYWYIFHSGHGLEESDRADFIAHLCRAVQLYRPAAVAVRSMMLQRDINDVLASEAFEKCGLSAAAPQQAESTRALNYAAPAVPTERDEREAQQHLSALYYSQEMSRSPNVLSAQFLAGEPSHVVRALVSSLASSAISRDELLRVLSTNGGILDAFVPADMFWLRGFGAQVRVAALLVHLRLYVPLRDALVRAARHAKISELFDLLIFALRNIDMPFFAAVELPAEFYHLFLAAAHHEYLDAGRHVPECDLDAYIHVLLAERAASPLVAAHYATLAGATDTAFALVEQHLPHLFEQH